MKKIKLLLSVALLGVMTLGAYSAYDYVTMSAQEKALLENIEALTEIETNPPVGRWRTVGCGGPRFDLWKTYCCPAVNWNNCQGKGDCFENQIMGCYDAPRHLEIISNRFL